MNRTEETAIEQEVKQLSEEWAAAELHGDVAFLRETLADNFVGVGPRGFMLTRDEWLQRISSGALKYQQFDWDEVQVRLHGDAAIVIGRQTQKAAYQGQPVEGVFRTTLVFVRQSGQWRLAGLQLSPIAGPPPVPRAQQPGA